MASSGHFGSAVVSIGSISMLPIALGTHCENRLLVWPGVMPAEVNGVEYVVRLEGTEVVGFD